MPTHDEVWPRPRTPGLADRLPTSGSGATTRDAALARALRGIRALVLDVDDTIVDTRAAMMEAGLTAAAALWPGRDDLHLGWARRYYEDPAEWFRRYAAGEVTFDTMRAARLAEAARALELTVPSDAARSFQDVYLPAFRKAQRLFPDVLPLLDAAEDRGLPIALLTNSSEDTTLMKLDVLGIAHRFGAVVTTDTIGVGKPDPRVYAEACRRAGAAVEESMCIGDNLECDVLGAAAAGLRSLWLDRAGAGCARRVTRVVDLAAVTVLLGTETGDLGG